MTGRGEVRSTDGTVIGYRRSGQGPGVILLHGGMKASQHFSGLAAALADRFTAIVPDRRGRGLSGPHGENFSVMREVEDVQALVAATGASRIFGLSSGGLVALRSALETPELERVALYEPPLSVRGSVPTGWVPRYDREIAAGRPAAALATALKGTGVEPVLGRLPRFLLVPMFALGARVEREPAEGEVPISALIPTQHFDMRIVEEMADTAGRYAALRTPVLLLGGGRSPASLGVALQTLEETLPNARRVTLPGLGHTGPEDEGDPLAVAAELRDFLAA
ncbi:MAG TPA: alpha/beta hydrolase [Candidatus Dormibacteraeota bacterium]|jgi:pimeloyl-ACP methyl ester carboxylesterase|nr:alpha/beta hydrolase [Candidatus Dormibacteraeota bacterium]